MEMPRILIADDQPHILEALQLLLKNEGLIPEMVNSPAAVVEALQKHQYDVLLLDLNYARDTTSGQEGLELLSRVRQFDDALPVVLMTAWGSIELAVEAMQGGGRDFVQKPWDNEKLLATLRRQIEEGQVLRRKKRERQDARDIQQRLLPAESPKLPGCDIRCFWQPAEEVGGDYFDAIRLNDATAAFCIADVAGKGLAAALLMSNMQASVRALAGSISSPAEMCLRLNRVALENTRSERFTTLFYAVVDGPRCSVRYCNAGHLPPVLVRPDGAVVRLVEGGTVLGVFPQAAYEEREIPFVAGDRLVLVTDGITEAANAQDEEFGEERLVRLLVQNRSRSASELQRSVIDAVSAHAGQALRDDATVMIVSNEGAVSDAAELASEKRYILHNP